MIKCRKIILLVFTFLILMLTIMPKTYATTFGNIIEQGDKFINSKDSSIKTLKEDELNDLSNTLYNVLLIIAIIAAFIVGGILGIKFITAGVEGKADIKELLLPYFIGCIVIFGAFTIWKLVVLALK